MPDPDSDTEPERRTDPRFDDWPVKRDDAFANVPVEHATPRGDGERHGGVPEDPEDGTADEVEWIGFAGLGGTISGPYLYDAEESAIYEGEHDAENDRLVLREETRREVDDDRSLGEHIEAIGEDHGWTWLSSFARTYLEDGDAEEPAGARTGLELRQTEFDRRNLPDSSSVDLGFFGSHTLVDESGQVHVVDRYFAIEDDDRDPVPVDVEEEFLLAKEPEAERREGDADMVQERHYSFGLDVGEDAVDPATRIESELRTWHAAHVGWPASE